MKHRLTGAALMVVVAVMVIPLLLKEPGIEASVGSSNNNAASQQIFKSKIEPLNLDNVNKLVTSADNPGEYDEVKPALMDPQDGFSNSSFDNAGQAGGKVKPEKPAASVQTASISGDPVVLTADKSKSTEEPGSVSTTSQSGTTVPKISIGDSGWTVRVGTFSKIENVESVSDLLNSSGFNAQHTKVQTTLGEATRVWLGPYSKKETAVKVSVRLKTLTGEKGYVTKHSP